MIESEGIDALDHDKNTSSDFALSEQMCHNHASTPGIFVGPRVLKLVLEIEFSEITEIDELIESSGGSCKSRTLRVSPPSRAIYPTPSSRVSRHCASDPSTV